MIELDPTRLRVFVFPRAPYAGQPIDSIGELHSNFGGWELSGDFVINCDEILDWLENHPEEAERLGQDRLRLSTRPSPPRD